MILATGHKVYRKTRLAVFSGASGFATLNRQMKVAVYRAGFGSFDEKCMD